MIGQWDLDTSTSCSLRRCMAVLRAGAAGLQEQEVQVQYLVCPGSADDMIWSIVNSKLHIVGATLDGHTAGTAAGESKPALVVRLSDEHHSGANVAEEACSSHGAAAAAWVKQGSWLFLGADCLMAPCRAQDHIH